MAARRKPLTMSSAESPSPGPGAVSMRALVSEAATPERVTPLELGSAVQPASMPAAVADSSPSALRRDGEDGAVPEVSRASVNSEDVRPPVSALRFIGCFIGATPLPQSPRVCGWRAPGREGRRRPGRRPR